MSKLPLETRPLRLSPAMAEEVEALLKPLNGSQLKAAQDAVLKIYRSGAQMDHASWVAAYRQAVAATLKEQRAAA